MGRAGSARTGVAPAPRRARAPHGPLGTRPRPAPVRAAAIARARVLAVVAVVVALAAACGPASGSATSVRTAVVASGADCLAPEVLGDLGLRLDPSLAAKASHTPAPTTGRVPSDFVPTGALVCQVGGQMRDGAGTWTAVTATSREGSAADVSALVAALDGAARTGAAGGTSPASSSCAADNRPVVLWLLDAMDRAVRPDLAVDGCGGPAAAVRAALEKLPVTGVVDEPVELVSPAS